MKRIKRGVPEGLWIRCPGCKGSIYRKEAENQNSFRAFFVGDPKIFIPRAIEGFCSARVLTTEFVDGDRFNAFAQRATQEQRNDVATLLQEYRSVQTRAFQAVVQSMRRPPMPEGARGGIKPVLHAL